MDKTRYECGWCREIVGVSAGELPPERACTGQLQHFTHSWTKKEIVLRSRIPFEVERRHLALAGGARK
ncbi:MAG: hypothetical protein ACHQ51_04255 [Elusimicrobiota bacterium]